MNPRRRNPDALRTIVLAWIDPDGGVEEYLDNWRTAYRRVPLAKTVIWANAGDTEDEGKARAYAKKEGNEVFIFPTTEKDPRGRAGREALAAWKAVEAAKEATRVKAEAKARRRKVVNPKLRRNSADRYEKVKALAERGSTEHERDTAARILAGLRSPAQEARAALDAARAKQAQQAAAAYEVLHALRPGDKVEVIFEPKSSSSPNDKRTVTVTGVQDVGQDRRRHVYTTSGRVMPGNFSGGAIMDYGDGEMYFQTTMTAQVRRVISLRVVGVAPKGAALIGAKANPRGKAPRPTRRNPGTVFCPKCSGTKAGGHLPQYSHVEGGICFLCQGKGVVTEKQASRWYAAQMKQDLPKGGAAGTGSGGSSELARKTLPQAKVETVLRALSDKAGIVADQDARIDIVRKRGDPPFFVMELIPSREAELDHNTVGGTVYFEGAPGAWKVFELSDSIRRFTTPAKMQAALNAIQRGTKSNPRKRKAPVKPKPRKGARRNPQGAITLTAAELAEALYSGWDGSWRISGYQPSTPEAVLNLGHYEGTKIPVRPIPGNLPLRVIPSFQPGATTREVGNIVRGLVEDGQGGWAAERFGPDLSATETRRVARWIEKRRR